MYRLQFQGAHQVFQAHEQAYPRDLVGRVSNAAAYLFSEFERLHILEINMNCGASTDPNSQRRKCNVRQALADGLRGDYFALIEKRNFAGVSKMKAARLLSETLIAIDPSYYDAYLAIGVENYLLGVTAAPVRWILRLDGAETDKDQGIANLKLTGEKGHYLAPYARLLLAVAALRDRDRNTARNLLAGLSREFPQNGLYQRELDRIQP